MRYTKICFQNAVRSVSRSALSLHRSNEVPNLLIRLMIPKLSIPTLLDNRFLEHMEQVTRVSLSKLNIFPTHELLPFSVLHCDTVPLDRLEAYVVQLSKLINCKQVSNRFELDFEYDTDISLRTKLLVPNKLFDFLRSQDEDFKALNSDKQVYMDNLNTHLESVIHLNIHTQNLIMGGLKGRLLQTRFMNPDPYYVRLDGDTKFDRYLYENFDTIDSDVMVFTFEEIREIMPRIVSIEHNTGCFIEVPKYNENYRLDDLLEVHIHGLNRFNTVKGIKNLSKYRK